MPPDTFRTELHNSLTAFYKKILKKGGTGGRPVAKPLICKFVAKTAHVPKSAHSGDANADADAVESSSAICFDVSFQSDTGQ